jgi:hypothetical protein
MHKPSYPLDLERDDDAPSGCTLPEVPTGWDGR